MADQEEERKPTVEEEEEDEGLFPISGYIALNVFFWAFCVGEVLLIRWWLKEIRGVVFFFGLLAVGFTLVSIYDCIYDRLVARSHRKEREALGDSVS